MACVFGSYDLADITANLDCCTLTFVASDGSYLFVFNMHDTIAINKDETVIIKDRQSYMSIDEADLLALGLTTTDINARGSLCRCTPYAAQESVPPPPPGTFGVASEGFRLLCQDDISGNPIPHLVETLNDVNSGVFVSYRIHYIGSTDAPVDVSTLARFYVCDGFNKKETEGLTLNPYCDDDGNITGYTAIIIDENSNVVQTLYFDSTQTEVATPPTGDPCNDELTVNCPTCV